MATSPRPSHITLGQNDKSSDDPRFCGLIRPWKTKGEADITIIGVPFDEGVRLSGGRVGAAGAPDAIRAQLSRYGTAYNIFHDADLSRLVIADRGNITPAKNSRAMHDRITSVTGDTLTRSQVVIVLGGGNDISYASVRALSETHGRSIRGANIDAHFDVRPVVNGKLTSGTPYRRLLDEGYLRGKHFVEIGAQGHTNAKAHRDYLRRKQASVVFLNDIRTNGPDRAMKEVAAKTKNCAAGFVSIDIDVVAQAFAPGSSAPSPDGLFPEDILRFAYLAGTMPKVRLFEIMEVNPLHDIDGRTSRLAANLILEFCAGYTMRKRS